MDRNIGLNSNNAEDYKPAMLLIGPPGIGKTAWAKRCIKDAEVVEVRDLCSHLPEDLLGIPHVINSKYVVWCPPDWLYRLSKESLGDKKGILILDDIAAASPAVQVATMSLVLERKVGSFEIGPNVQIVLTANRRGDKSGAMTLPSALINRCETIDFIQDFDSRFGKPLFQDWCDWYFAQDNLPSCIPSFLRFMSSLFICTPASTSRKEDSEDGIAKAGADELGRFATPRSWTFAAKALRDMGEKLDYGTDRVSESGNVLQTVIGFIGEAAAVQFAAYMRHWGDFVSLDLDKVIKDPKTHLKTVPTEQSRLLALIGALTNHILRKYSALEKKKEKIEWTTKDVIEVFDYVSRGKGHQEMEYFSWAYSLVSRGLNRVSPELKKKFEKDVVEIISTSHKELKDFFLNLQKESVS